MEAPKEWDRKKEEPKRLGLKDRGHKKSGSLLTLNHIVDSKSIEQEQGNQFSKLWATIKELTECNL